MSAAEDYDDAVTCEGDTEAKTRIRDWLVKNIKTSIELEGEDIPLELWNVGQGADGAIYSTEWDVTEPVDDVVDEIMDRAIEDAMSVGRGSVRFKVVVEGRKKLGRAAFTLKIPQNDSLSSDDIEDIEELATRKGLLTQLMRHQEKTMKVGLGGSDKVMAHMTRMLDTAHTRIRELEAQSLANVKAYEELLSGKHMRDLELRKLTNEERNKEQVVGILMQGMPLLLNKFLSGRSPDAGAAPGAAPGGAPGTRVDEPLTKLELMLEGFLSTFTPAQIQDIMAKNVFTGPQMMMFMEIAQVLQERNAARQGGTPPPQAG